MLAVRGSISSASSVLVPFALGLLGGCGRVGYAPLGAPCNAPADCASDRCFGSVCRPVFRVVVHAYNVDDTADVYLNGNRILEQPFNTDSGLVDLSSSVPPGANMLELTTTNVGSGYTWGWEVLVDGTA